jgi:hypothetical protein
MTSLYDLDQYLMIGNIRAVINAGLQSDARMISMSDSRQGGVQLAMSEDRKC